MHLPVTINVRSDGFELSDKLDSVIYRQQVGHLLEKITPPRLAALRRMAFCIPEKNAFLDNPGAFSGTADAIGLRIDHMTMTELIDNIDAMRALQAIGIVEEGGERIFEKILVYASFNLPLRILDPGVLTAEERARLIAYYFTSPTLETPIEPLHAIINAMVNQSSFHLNRYLSHSVGETFFIDPDGRVAISPKTARRGEFLGHIGDTFKDMGESEAWRKACDLTFEHFSRISECATCPYYPLCQTFLLDEKCQSSDWIDIIDKLHHKTRKIQTTA